MRLFAYITGLLLMSLLIANWTDRNLDFWLSYLKEDTVDVPFLLSWAASLLGPFSIGFNIIAELGRLAI